jgi:hypothetical protein
MILLKNNISNFLITICAYSLGIFYNRGITLKLHSEGLIYNKQSQELFVSGLINPYPQRILTPFLSSILNLTTQELNLVFIFIFLFLVNFRLKEFNILTQIISSITFATTMPVIFSMNFGGYPDIVSYSIFILILIVIDKKYLPYILYLLLLLTREAFLVYLPFFILYKSFLSKQKFYISSIGFCVTTGIYFLYYLISFKLASSTPGEIWDYSFYLQPLVSSSNIFYWFEKFKLNYFIGIFSTSKFLIVLLLIVFLNLKIKQKLIYIFFILLTLSTSLVCGDISRCFSPLIFTLLLFPEALKIKNLNITLLILFCLNLISPKYYVWHGGKLNYLNDSRLHFLDIFKLF